jgi:hypothetical protein
MKQNRSIQLAYLAGLIDGEGCIYIKKSEKDANKQQKYASYTLSICINQTDKESIDYIKGIFGGNITIGKQYGLGYLPVMRWEVGHQRTFELCKDLIPFLRIKKKQAELAVRFYYYKQKCERIREFIRSKRIPVGKDTIGRTLYVRSFSSRQLDKLQWMFEEMKRLKDIHNLSASVETKQLKPVNTASDSPTVIK